MDYAIRIDGLDELIKRFDAANEVINKELHRAMYRVVVGELGRMPKYPPKPDGSTYIRTTMLGKSLTAMVGRETGAASRVENMAGGSVRGVIGTNMVYAPFVIGRDQAKVHRGRWWRLEESVASHKADIEAEFQDAAQRIVESLAD